MPRDEIEMAIRKENPDFRKDNSTVNHTYNYVKFVDDISEQTVLFFLSDDDECIYVRWIADYANLNEITGTLNKRYSSQGENSWTYSDDGKRYSVKLEESEWYFTVNYTEN